MANIIGTMLTVSRCAIGRETSSKWYGLFVEIDDTNKGEDQLRRSEAYLTEAQRLSHTGSFGWTPSTGELHWSDEKFGFSSRSEYQANGRTGAAGNSPRRQCKNASAFFDATASGENDFDVAHRLSMPDGSVKFVHPLSHASAHHESIGSSPSATQMSTKVSGLATNDGDVASWNVLIKATSNRATGVVVGATLMGKAEIMCYRSS